MDNSSSKLMTCIATVSIAGDFREKLAAISRAGYTGIEIFEQDFVAYDGAAVDVGWLVQDYGLEIRVSVVRIRPRAPSFQLLTKLSALSV